MAKRKPKLLSAHDDGSVTVSSTLETDIFNYRSSEFFINMDKKHIPPKGHPDRAAFVINEREKCRRGVTINGVHIWGSLYYTLNYHMIQKDGLDEYGKGIRVDGLPDLRDNEWIIHRDYNAAINHVDPISGEAARKHFLFGSGRQQGKSEALVSLTLRELFLFRNTEALVLMSNSQDKQTFTKKAQVAITKGEKFIVVPNIDKNWKNTEIRFGYTQTDNEADIFSRLFIYNTDGDNNTEIGAGKTISFFAYDEIAKNPVNGALSAVLPAFVSKYGVRCSAFMCFTGGNAEKSKDAEDMFFNPDGKDILSFDYKGRKIAKFNGGWYRQDFKKPQNFREFLSNEGYKIEGPSEFDRMTIQVTDFDKANLVLDREAENAKKSNDPKGFLKAKMYDPRTPEEMFLRDSVNKYPLNAITKHKEYLRDNSIGTAVEFVKAPRTGKVSHILSSKRPLMQFDVSKFRKEDKEAPVMIYDYPKYTDYSLLHVMGVDPYREDESQESQSLGSFYVGRRMHSDLSDPFRNRMVASYTGRPKSAAEFNELVEMVADYYNAKIMYEHSDRGLLTYFDDRHKTMQRLIPTTPLQKDIKFDSKVMTNYGLRPTAPNQIYLLNQELAYLNETLEDESLGLTRILDPMLLEEYEAFHEGGNYDRIIAFQHMIAAMRYFDKYGIVPTKDEQAENENQSASEIQSVGSVFGFSTGSTTRSAFGMF